MRPIKALVDLAAIDSNLDVARECVPGTPLVAVLKANAFGHGATAVASHLKSADAFAVSCLEEAIELRRVILDKPIFLLEGFFEISELEAIRQLCLWPVLHSFEQVIQVSKETKSEVSVWLKFDTGMNRLGFRPQDLASAVHELAVKAPHVHVVGLMSHLSSADETWNPTTTSQYHQVASVDRSGLELSVANSAGILQWPTANGEWIRPGIMLFGASPFADRTGPALGLTPAMTLQSSLIGVRHCTKGESVGYGGTWVCPDDMPVGVVAGGYADGYPRAAPSGTALLVNDQRVPLVGRVCMDMLMVDLRAQPNARAGDKVVLWGTALPVEEIALQARTIPNHLLTGVTARVPRIYVTPKEQSQPARR